VKRERIIPLVLTPIVLAIDQISKYIVERNIGLGEIVRVWGDFLWLWHVRNRAMAFSLGEQLPDFVRAIVSVVLPLLVLGGILVYYLTTSDITTFQRWCFAAILGGGLGNILDRFFRADGVVDFISVKFYGIFGWPRWPTFNAADSSVVIGGILLLVSFVMQEMRSKR
jgi:signal peptidase II